MLPIQRDFKQRNRGADGCASAARYLCFGFTIVNDYELRRIGDGSTFRTNRSFRPVKVETISSKVKREKGSVDR